jgi:hypothetical protein
MSEVTPEELDRVRRARRYVHALTCPVKLDDECFACPRPRGVLDALRVLDSNPRDARGARRALHDVACMSGCGADSDHADRTQARAAAALRKFHAKEVAA